MSEFSSGFSDVDARDINAEVFNYSLQLASSPAELRLALQDNGHPHPLHESSKQALVTLADTMTERLWALGLDLSDTTDGRIDTFTKGVDILKSAPEEALGATRKPHATEWPALIMVSGFGRLLSGIDMRSKDRIQLLPQESLRPKELFNEIAKAALAFTGGEAYTHQGVSYPRKAGRTITDVESPFWGFGIATDDYPGKQFGWDGYGPNVHVWVPTGTLTDESVLGLKQFAYLSNDVWKNKTTAGYVPAAVAAQSMRMGVMSHGQDQVDTANGQVAAFLRAAETM